MIYNDEGKKEYATRVLLEIKGEVKKTGIKILNAGCGNNWLKKYGSKGVVIHGLDINNPQADIKANLEKRLPIKDQTYDAVVLIHVIEHLKNPLFCLKELRRILKKGGVIYISTPSPWSPNAWEDPYHIRPYTVGAIITLGKDADLEKIKGFYTNNAPLFGALGIEKLEKFYQWFTYDLRFLSQINYFKGNTEVILRK